MRRLPSFSRSLLARAVSVASRRPASAIAVPYMVARRLIAEIVKLARSVVEALGVAGILLGSLPRVDRVTNELSCFGSERWYNVMKVCSFSLRQDRVSISG